MKKYVLIFLITAGSIHARGSESDFQKQLIDAIATIAVLLEDAGTETDTPSKVAGFLFSKPNQKEKLKEVEEALRSLQTQHLEVVAQVGTLAADKQKLEDHNRRQLELFTALQQEHQALRGDHQTLQAEAQTTEVFSKNLSESLDGLQTLYKNYRSSLETIENERNQKKETAAPVI